MGEAVRFRRPRPSGKHKGKTLSQHGFHKWAVLKESVFDVKDGRLVTIPLRALRRCQERGALRAAVSHPPVVPGPPLKGPTMAAVIQPP